jgi:hypothetical protein
MTPEEKARKNIDAMLTIIRLDRAGLQAMTRHDGVEAFVTDLTATKTL